MTGTPTRFRQYRRYHRDLRPYALVLPRETVSPRTLPVMRRLAARTRPHPAALVTDLGGGVRVRVFGDTGSRAPGPALLWIHGGGFVFGTAAHDDRWCHQIAARTGVLVASVDYRLAPDLAGLPPAWITVGDQDLLHAQNARYHQALTTAEVDSRLRLPRLRHRRTHHHDQP
ncbi:alpha/beta hydrolase [Nocardia stercoris]|uniref:alpha/beta hydrolase n=1 Tax=Nocardia stercoris TaxID=2483361 RepID=UPI0026B4A500|nr:alpha/beta hydrolase [Nocardia stercoris]